MQAVWTPRELKQDVLQFSAHAHPMQVGCHSRKGSPVLALLFSIWKMAFALFLRIHHLDFACRNFVPTLVRLQHIYIMTQ